MEDNKEINYVDFRIAKHLKDKGFHVPVKHYFNSDGTSMISSMEWDWNDDNFPGFSKPSYQDVRKWLHTAHGIEVVLEPRILENDNIIYVYNIMHMDFKRFKKYGTFRIERGGGFNKPIDAVIYGVEHAIFYV